MQQIVEQIVTLIVSCKLPVSFCKERQHSSLTKIADTYSNFSFLASKVNQQVEQSRGMLYPLQIHEHTSDDCLPHAFRMRLACDSQHNDSIKLRNLAVLGYR